MFSNRFDWQAQPNALSTLLAQKKAAGQSVIDLTQSNPTRVGLAYDHEAILAALSQAAALVYEPDARGWPGARRAIAEYYQEKGCAIDPEKLFLTASTSEAYGLLFKLLADGGDEVLIPSPGYPLLAYLARFEGLQAVAYPLRYDPEQGWQIDLDLLEALIAPKTRAILVVSPNNPTGSYVKPKELSILDELCRRHDLALVVDEVFADFAADPSASNRLGSVLGRTQCLTFVLNGFSKVLALPQIKLGWIAMAGQARLTLEAGHRLESLLDFYLPVSAPVQYAVAPLLGLRPAIQSQIIQRLQDNEQILRAQVAGLSNSRLLRREGGWYAIIEVADHLGDEERVIQLLAQANTLVHPGFFYDFHRDGFLVLSLLPEPSTFQTGVLNILQAFGKQSA
ncbi:MAG: pyridoxal phosphate-dependent aminotransferase [Desulfobacteraceae bacterium]|nr:pyridoxal phosphate-dependent aminotransferase [Desulfobacteraceae bacterium]